MKRMKYSARRKYKAIALIFAAFCVALFLLFSNMHSKMDVLSPEAIISADRLYALTNEDKVIEHLKKFKRLPSYYITKKQAKILGWDARDGNLCDISDFKAIGGDRFYNREKKLPNLKRRKWFEADINYHCGHRGSDRLIYSNDHLFYVTHDHYKTFEQR